MTQQFFISKVIPYVIPPMYKTALLTALMVPLASLSAVASTQTVNLSPKAAHTLDFKSQGCTVEKAFFGDPSAAQHLELNLDQPQPQTQKITLRWKSKSNLDEVFIQLHLQGCSQDYAQVSLKRVDTPPASPVTYINASTAQAPVEQSAATRPPLTPVRGFPSGQQVAAGQPIPLNLSTPTRPKTVKRPPVRRFSVPKRPKSGLTANRLQPRNSINPTSILKGLNVARSKGEISYRSDMHYRVNGMIRAMRRGSEYQAAGKQAGVPESVIEALISYSQQ